MTYKAGQRVLLTTYFPWATGYYCFYRCRVANICIISPYFRWNRVAAVHQQNNLRSRVIRFDLLGCGHNARGRSVASCPALSRTTFPRRTWRSRRTSRRGGRVRKRVRVRTQCWGAYLHLVPHCMGLHSHEGHGDH